MFKAGSLKTELRVGSVWCAATSYLPQAFEVRYVMTAQAPSLFWEFFVSFVPS